MAVKNEMTLEIRDREAILTRIISAPRELVFDAWTKAEHLSQWFGPHGFTTTAETDPRVGGKFRITMHGTDALGPEFAGQDYPMKGVYKEFVPPERLVYTSDLSEHPEQWKKQIKEACGSPNDVDVLQGVTTVTFEESDGKTKVTIRYTFASEAIRDGYLKTGMKEGWGECLDRLEELVEKA